MIHYFGFPTPNGRKVSVALEVLELPYERHFIDIRRNDQFAPEFLRLSPNNKIPAIIDTDGPGGQPIGLFESAAILLYLAEKTGRLLPTDARERLEVFEWMCFQVGHIGPMLGQKNHFAEYASEKIPYAIERYTNETKRLFGVVEQRLAGRDWLAGSAFSVADILNFGWLRGDSVRTDHADAWPNLARWVARVAEQPGVERGWQVLVPEVEQKAPFTEETRAALRLIDG
ncbi:MAG: glutathione S-transferase N-terminal domain-containing protein [Deltaproteobacteria bacterium]|nr:glutathione S-transferase N-terminal domain-containing protein [Deltaproteobacteria bacterium]